MMAWIEPTNSGSRTGTAALSAAPPTGLLIPAEVARKFWDDFARHSDLMSLGIPG
jgi:hypothetical protein